MKKDRGVFGALLEKKMAKREGWGGGPIVQKNSCPSRANQPKGKKGKGATQENSLAD